MLGIQDFVQAEQIYHDAATLLFTQPGTRIFFRPQAHQQAKIISESLGVETVYDRHVTGTCQIAEKEFARDLMTTGAVLALAKGKAVAFTPETPPILLDRVKPQDYDTYTQVAPPEFRELEVDDRLVAALAEENTQPQSVAQEPPREKVAETEEHVRLAAKQRSFNDFGDRMPNV